jgi:hypothetical protein
MPLTTQENRKHVTFSLFMRLLSVQVHKSVLCRLYSLLENKKRNLLKECGSIQLSENPIFHFEVSGSRQPLIDLRHWIIIIMGTIDHSVS